MTLTIDTEFKNLIPSLTDEEFSGLEANIVAEGRARVPLDVWNGTLLAALCGRPRKWQALRTLPSA
jgi:hypothetical protein